MGCGPSTPASIERLPGSGRLTVYGDHFNSDTRALLGILKVSGVPHQFEKISLLQEQNKQPSYLAQNPSGQIPMITEGQFKIIGGGNSLV